MIKTVLFKDINETEYKQISKYLEKKHYPKGSYIFHSGDFTSKIGIVEKGSVNIENIDLWGNRSVLGNVGDGQVFAESYVLAKEMLMVDVIAIVDSDILFLDVDVLKNHHCSCYIKIINNLLDITTKKNLNLSNRIFHTSSKKIRSRLLSYLSYMSKKANSTTFNIPFDRQGLADYLNVDRSALSKELGKMKDEGLIEFYKNTFKLKQI